jgi:GTP-binding protein LepA
MDPKFIRNFSIIAHIDHGKSTLADRMLEVTATIEKRKMREQVLDSMDLERERGITIKMTPVCMHHKLSGVDYNLNLIDTPGHIDFSYEVSRAMKAVEGALLLVDATQGVQAQTLTTLRMARDAGLVIIPVLSKIDSPLARIAEVKQEIIKLLQCTEESIMETSGKTGQGVAELLEAIITRVPAPTAGVTEGLRSLVFDFQYSDHKGIILYVRVFDGKVKRFDELVLNAVNKRFQALEVGVFSPTPLPQETIGMGQIGYIVTGIKEPGVANVGDTVLSFRGKLEALPGYMAPAPVVWASVYPESQDDFNTLKQALLRLKLTDSSLTFEEEQSGSLGRGFRCGFLGMLHLEIITERLSREFDLELIITTPSIIYEVTLKNGKKEMVYTPSLFPEHGNVAEVYEPWAKVSIITPPEHLGNLMQLLYVHEASVLETTDFEERTTLVIEMPLRELMRNFFDEVKSASSGYASLSYEMLPLRKASVTKLDLLVAEEEVPAFARVVPTNRAQEEAEDAVVRLYSVLPKQLFVTKIQGKALGRIIASRSLPALKKNVTANLYGGDITRKRKLWEKQKRGKERLQAHGKVSIPQEVFLKMMRAGSEDVPKDFKR